MDAILHSLPRRVRAVVNAFDPHAIDSECHPLHFSPSVFCSAVCAMDTSFRAFPSDGLVVFHLYTLSRVEHDIRGTHCRGRLALHSTFLLDSGAFGCSVLSTQPKLPARPIERHLDWLPQARYFSHPRGRYVAAAKDVGTPARGTEDPCAV
jgi:hypothetical protein